MGFWGADLRVAAWGDSFFCMSNRAVAEAEFVFSYF